MGADGGIYIMRHDDWPADYRAMTFPTDYGTTETVAQMLRIVPMTICGTPYVVCYCDTNGHPYNEEHYWLSQQIDCALRHIAWIREERVNLAEHVRAADIAKAEQRISEALAAPGIERDKQVYVVWKWFLEHAEYHELWT